MKKPSPASDNEPTIVIHGNPWKFKDIADDLALLISQQWHQEIWKPTPALIHKKGGRSTQYRGQKYDPEKIDLVPDGWNHEHCAICWWTLHETDKKDEGTGYRNDANVWLCSECYHQFIEADILNLKQTANKGLVRTGDPRTARQSAQP